MYRFRVTKLFRAIVIVSAVVLLSVYLYMYLAQTVLLNTGSLDPWQQCTSPELQISTAWIYDRPLTGDILAKSPELQISTAWIYDRPLTGDILVNIEQLGSINPVRVYCGTSQCVQAVMNMKHPNITSEFLEINNLVKDTPLEEWLARHPLYKVLAGLEFEDHLHRVVQLGILWKHGGIYFNPRIRVNVGTSADRVYLENTCYKSWISNHSTSNHDISCFPKRNAFIKTLAEQFVEDYSRNVPKRSKKNTKFTFQFESIFKCTLKYYNCTKSNNTATCPDFVPLHYSKHYHNESSLSELRHHFGTLSYELRVKRIRGCNLGDEIQSLSGVQFLPFVDNLLERDNMSLLEEKQPVTVFFNAWYGDMSADWPPPENIVPIMTSIHIQRYMESIWANCRNYLKQHEPVGSRDLDTMTFFRRINVKSYFSGCMTLMLKNSRRLKPRSNEVYIVDVKNKEHMKLFPPEIVKRSNFSLTHAYPIWAAGNLKQFAEAYKLLELYASAKLVITQRIHCALPCVALGTPVIFIQSPKLPGGEGSETQSSPRTHGLTSMFHTVDLYKMSPTEAKEWLSKFDWNNPPPNPNLQILMRFRATFWNIIRQHQPLYDAAYKFGMIPILPPPMTASAQEPAYHKLLFHVIFSELNFKWYHWRSVESIFYHHPFAEVIIYSNTLNQSEFKVMTEVSYSIKVQRYSLIDMLKDCADEEFISSAALAPHWQKHQIDLFRLLTLYKQGGIYMDSDVIVVNPLGSLRNILAWQDANNQSLSGAFMAFEKGNRFLRDCLMVFENYYNHGGELSKDLLTSVWKRHTYYDGEVVTMSSDHFHMFSKHNIKLECFMVSSSLNAKMKILTDEAYTVSMDPGNEGIDFELTNGTICKHIFNSYCVLCNKQY